jgi:alpha-L-rhamnosidase
MRTKTILVLSVLAVLAFSSANAGVNSFGPFDKAQQITPKLLSDRWSADWIAPSGAPPFDYGVYHFRRTFDLAAKPSTFVVHVSGDNRYRLYVNGTRVAWGPARGDLFHWRFETVDIAPHLKAGRNAIAAVVWNFSKMAPMAQITSQTGFVLQGDTPTEQVADTSASWKAIRNRAYQPLPVTFEEMHGYFVAGPGEKVDGRQYPWGWEQTDFDDSVWPAADVIVYASARDARDSHSPWMLVPRSIPFMEEKPERFASVRQSRGTKVPDQFPAAPGVLQIPARTKAQLLLDQSYLTTAYPELVVSGGRGASVTLRYAESLFKAVPQGFTKGNRNEVEGKKFVGYRDVFIADGGRQRIFRPLWWRTYRFVELTIETLDAPITVEDLRGVYTGYPFVRKARLEVADPSESRRLGRILDTGWRTARLCAHETYMDCPYYEQLQYVGDTRIQGLVSLYTSGDARLLRNAIDQINESRVPEGATMSRAPTRLQQFIPPFSLWWIGMVHDYWMYQDDPAFVKEMLPGVRSVLSFFSARQKPNGSLGRVPWWNYVDWVNQWTDGVPPVGEDGSSALLDLQLLLAVDWAAEMEGAMGSKALAAEYGSKAAQLRTAIQQLYWDPDRNLYADTPDRKDYSQFANALAVLAGVVRGPAARDLVDRILADKDIVQCTYYSRFYLYSAVNRVGSGDRYLDLLGEWDAMLARGLTTWAETPESPEHTSRSDCHAWSAHPNFELFRTVLGVDSASPGFSKVLIRPFLGTLKGASGTIPHPKGEISVRLAISGKELEAEISLPPGVTGSLEWGGASRPLPSGMTRTRI